MLLNFLTFSLLITGICGTGELSVLQAPKSIKFRGTDSLDSFYVADVILAALGNAVAGKIDWRGMVIQDPFNLAKTAVLIVHFRGIFHVTTAAKGKHYELLESDTENSLNYLVEQLPSNTVTNIDFCQHSEGVEAYQDYFGKKEVPGVLPLEHLKPLEYFSHKDFLDELGYVMAASKNLSGFLKPSHVLIFRISLNRITKVARYAIINEAKSLITTAVGELLAAAVEHTDSLLFIQTTDRRLPSKTALRSGQNANKTNPFKNTIRDYNFSVVVNIVIWFGLFYAFALASICYIIVNMDPGKDSIIYRDSANTLMKKRR